ncbi:hypothetical protein [Streptomyces sp. NPDC055134]
MEVVLVAAVCPACSANCQQYTVSQIGLRSTDLALQDGDLVP